MTRALAKRMLAAGAGKGTRVGIAFPSSVDWMVGWIAAARIGAVSMLFSSTYQPPELRAAMRIGDVSLLLAPRKLLGKDYEAHLEQAVPGLAEHGPGPLYVPALPYLRAIWIVGGSGRPWVTPVTFDAPMRPTTRASPTRCSRRWKSEVTPADIAVVVYTSGQRGRAQSRRAHARHGRAQDVDGVERRAPGFVPGAARVLRDAVLLGGRRADARGRAAQRLRDRLPGALRRGRRARPHRARAGHHDVGLGNHAHRDQRGFR